MTAENAHEFSRCIDAFSHPRYEIIPTGEVWDGKDGVNTLLLQNKTAFPDFKFIPASMHYADEAVFVEGRFTGRHLGSWRGLPATGRKIDFPLIIAFLFDGDRMSQWNAGDAPMRIYYEHRAALTSAEIFFETQFGLSREGKLSPTGVIDLLQAAALLEEVSDFIRPASPPVFLQHVISPPLMAIARWRGYRARYARYRAAELKVTPRHEGA